MQIKSSGARIAADIILYCATFSNNIQYWQKPQKCYWSAWGQCFYLKLILMLVVMFVCPYGWWTYSFDIRQYISGCCVLFRQNHVYQAKYLYVTNHLILYLAKLSVRYLLISLGVFDLIQTQCTLKCQSVSPGNVPNGLYDFFETGNFACPSGIFNPEHAWFVLNHIKGMEPSPWQLIS